MPAVFAYSLAHSLRPILRQAAQQLTLLGRVVDLDDFSDAWLGEPQAYRHLGGMDLLELASVVGCLEIELGILLMELEAEWDQAKDDRDRWLANVRLRTVRALVKQLRAWKRDSDWIEVGFE